MQSRASFGELSTRHRRTDDVSINALRRAPPASWFVREVVEWDQSDVVARLAPLHPADNTFPGEVLLQLAGEAIGASGANSQSPLAFKGIGERCLAGGIEHMKAQHHRSSCELRATAMLHGGVDRGLLDEVQWWRTDDLSYWTLEALATYVRAADPPDNPSSRFAVGSPTSTTSPAGDDVP